MDKRDAVDGGGDTAKLPEKKEESTFPEKKSGNKKGRSHKEKREYLHGPTRGGGYT